jgi:hypothetical protein
MVNQKTAVTNVVLTIFPDYELSGETILKGLLNTDTKKQMRALLFEGFRAGEISMSDEAQAKAVDDAYLNKYVSGLLDNWVRKNPEFNNSFKASPGGKYETKNPGSRAGSGDESIREMRKLLKTVTDEATRTEIQEAIDARIAEVSPEKVVTIKAEAIPEHLRHLVK